MHEIIYSTPQIWFDDKEALKQNLKGNNVYIKIK